MGAGGRQSKGEGGRKAGLGPEPLDPEFTPEALAGRLSGRAAPVKALLCDQAFVAGIGNIYADAVLFLACIHPLTPGGGLSMVDARRATHGYRGEAVGGHGGAGPVVCPERAARLRRQPAGAVAVASEGGGGLRALWGAGQASHRAGEERLLLPAAPGGIPALTSPAARGEDQALRSSMPRLRLRARVTLILRLHHSPLTGRRASSR